MPPPKLKKIAYTVYLEPLQVAGLARLNQSTKVPKSELIREGIDLMLEKREMPAFKRQWEKVS